MKLADTPDLGSGAFGLGGSSPPSRTLLHKKAFPFFSRLIPIDDRGPPSPLRGIAFLLRSFSYGRYPGWRPSLIQPHLRPLIILLCFGLFSCSTQQRTPNPDQTFRQETASLRRELQAEIPRLVASQSPRDIRLPFSLKQQSGRSLPTVMVHNLNSRQESTDEVLVLDTLVLRPERWSLSSSRISQDGNTLALVISENGSWHSLIALVDFHTRQHALYSTSFIEDSGFCGDLFLASTRRQLGASAIESFSAPPAVRRTHTLHSHRSEDASHEFRPSSSGDVVFILKNSLTSRTLEALCRTGVMVEVPDVLREFQHVYDLDIDRNGTGVISGIDSHGTHGVFAIGDSSTTLVPLLTGTFVTLSIYGDTAYVQNRTLTGAMLHSLNLKTHKSHALPNSSWCSTLRPPLTASVPATPTFSCPSYIDPPITFQNAHMFEKLSRTKGDVLLAPTSDGTQIPLELIAPEDATPQGLLAIMYGSYGATLEPQFSPWLRALHERGYGVVIIHQRGGGYLGTAWHAAGRFPQKHRALLDARDALSFLHSTFPNLKVDLYARSAGGTLALALTLRWPNLVRRVFLDRPFVSPIKALTLARNSLDARDRAEWGDPRIPRTRKTMEEYDPVALLHSGLRLAVPLALSCGDHDILTPCTDIAEAAELLRSTRTIPSSPVVFRYSTGSHTDEASQEDRESALLDRLTFFLHQAPNEALQHSR